MGDTLTYSLSGTDASALSVSASGVITFNSAPDYETKTTYSVTVNVGDGSIITSKTLTINITDVNETGGNSPPSFVGSAVTLTAGERHTCVIDDSGVKCWGDNTYGQTSVPSLSNPTQINTSISHTCAIDDNGVKCWGSNGQGQTTVPSLSNPTQVSAGWQHTCAIDDSGVKCWGSNNYWQNNVPSLSNPTQVSAGYYHTCVIDDSGVKCWGYNGQGQTTIPSLSNATQVSTGTDHTCAIDDSGVKCWGDNANGQTTIPSLSNATQLSVGSYHTCVIDDSGVKCWGYNGQGQTTVPSLSNPTQVSAGYFHTCAIDDTGVKCWGGNDYDQTTVPSGLSFTNSSSGSSSSSSNASSNSSSSSSSSNSDSSSSESSNSSSSSSGYDSSFFNKPDSSSDEQELGLGNNSSFSQEFGDQDSSFSFGGFGSFGGFEAFSNISDNSIEGVLNVSSPSAAEVYIDQNLNGIKDFSEPSGFTSSSGKFSITGINDQQYECLKTKPLIATLSSGEEFYSIDINNTNSSKAITAFSSLHEQPIKPALFQTSCDDSPATRILLRSSLKNLDLRLQQGFDVSLNDLLQDPREADLSSPIDEERALAIEEFIRSAEIIENKIFSEFSSQLWSAGVKHTSASSLPIENYSIFLSDTYPNPTTKTSPTVTSIDQVSVKMNALFLATLENAVGPWNSYALISSNPLISNAGMLIEDKDACLVGFNSLCKIEPSFFGLFQYPGTGINWVYHKSSLKGEELVGENAGILDDGSCYQGNTVAIVGDDTISPSATKKTHQYLNTALNGNFDYDILECEPHKSSYGFRQLILQERYPSGAIAGVVIIVSYDSINDRTINLLEGLDDFNWESIDSGDVVPTSIPSDFSTRFQELSFSKQMYDSLPWGDSIFSQQNFRVYFSMMDKNGYHSTLVNFPGGVACLPANFQDFSSSTSDSSGAKEVVDRCFEYLDKNFIWPDSVDQTIFNNPDAFSTLDPYDR